MEVNGGCQLSVYKTVVSDLFLCSTGERNSYRVGKTLGWWNDYFFGWTIPFKRHANLSALWCDSCV